MKVRGLQFIGGTSRKFWTIMPPVRLDDRWLVTVHFGRIGTEGQTRTKVFSTSYGATADFNNRVNQKLSKGYSETKFKDITKPKKATTFVAKSVIEWDGKKDPKIEKKVRRFIDLSWRKTA